MFLLLLREVVERVISGFRPLGLSSEDVEAILYAVPSLLIMTGMACPSARSGVTADFLTGTFGVPLELDAFTVMGESAKEGCEYPVCPSGLAMAGCSVFGPTARSSRLRLIT